MMMVLQKLFNHHANTTGAKGQGSPLPKGAGTYGVLASGAPDQQQQQQSVLAGKPLFNAALPTPASAVPYVAGTELPEAAAFPSSPPPSEAYTDNLPPASQLGKGGFANKASSSPPLALNSFEDIEALLYRINHLPLWVKQVFYTGLRDDLEHFMTSKTLVNLKSEHLPQLWEPHFLEAGAYALTTSKIQNTPALKALLESAHRKEKVLKLCSDKAWSLEQACQGLCMAMENQWIEQPAEPQLLAAVRYMGNRTRLGEYLVEIGRLDKEHLDQALQTQQYMQSALGETMGLGDILIRLQLIGQAEAEAILFLKHESKKPYKAR